MRFSANFSANLLGAGVACLMVLTACKTDISDTGLGILPPGDLVNADLIDSLEVILETRRKDSVRTDNRTFQLLGSTLDPEFGRISSEVYTEILPSISNLDFGDPDSIRLDSAILQIRLVGYYGRGEDPVRLHVRELSEAIPDTIVYSSRSLAAYPNEIADPVTVALSSSSVSQTVKFQLHTDFANKILFADTAALVDDDAFRTLIKGLVFSAEEPAFTSREPGAMLVLQNTYTSVLLYYSVLNDSTGEYEESPVYPQEFSADGSANCFHTFRRSDYEWRTFGQELTGNRYEFLQAGTLVNLFCKIPKLESLSRMTVHKAELMLHIDSTLFGSVQGSSFRYAPPSALTIYLADSTGNFLLDDDDRPTVLLSSVSYDATEKAYPISLTSLTQAIINQEEENYGMILVPKDSSSSITRAAIFGNGTTNPDKKPKFSIYYSTIP